MSTKRRDTLRALATLTVLPATAQTHSHHQAQANGTPAVTASGPKFFSPDEIRKLAAWTDLIIPRTDTPGAADAGVPMLMDFYATRNASRGKQWKEMLGWLETQASEAAARAALLDRISKETGTPGARYFQLLKDTTIDFYYSTREGLQQELGWNANTFLAEFKGCTHPEHQS